MKYKNVNEVLESLKRNPDLKIKDNVIYRKNPMDSSYAGKVGNSVLSKLDYLMKNGFTVCMMEVGETVKQTDKRFGLLVSEPQQQETVRIRPRIKLRRE